MRIFIQIIAIILVGYLAELFLPWYSVAFVAFIFGYYFRSESNFLGGFLGVALLWLMKILLITSVASTEFASKVAQLFPVKDQWLLILVSILLGGLVGGFAALTGGLARGKPQKTKYRGELGF